MNSAKHPGCLVLPLVQAQADLHLVLTMGLSETVSGVRSPRVGESLVHLEKRS